MTENTAPQTPAYDLDKVILRLHAARVVASERQPYLSTALFAMVPVKVDGLGTMASDAKWRLYYDPNKIMEWPVEQLAGVLLHEVGHCIRGHAERFTALNERHNLNRVFNIAGDSVINADLRDDRISLPEGAVYVDTINETYGIDATREMSAEQIYKMLREKLEEMAQDMCTCGDQQEQDQDNGEQGQSQTQSGDNGEGQNNEGQGQGDSSSQQDGNGAEQNQGQGGQGNCPIHSQGWDCGSASDGIRRDYEAEGDKVDPGVDEDRGDLIRQQVAVEITNHVRNRGTVPAGYARWAKELLEPTVDWRRELSSIVRRTFAQVAGLRDYTYQRPSRRDSSMKISGQGIVLPAMRQPNPPRVAIVIDTSGSMSDEMLTWALTETQGVLRSLGSSGRQVRVVSCDAKASTQRVTQVSQVKLQGGGGTDMRVGINEAMESREKPDAIVLITDGLTPYPDEPLKGTTLIVALTDEGATDAVPHWARKVLVTQN